MPNWYADNDTDTRLVICRCVAGRPNRDMDTPHNALTRVGCVWDETGHFCGECGDQIEPTVVDNGIGYYEYWGFRGFDSQPDVVSPCCGATVFDDPELNCEANLSPSDLEDDPSHYYDPDWD
jgi:hypothetical protein